MSQRISTTSIGLFIVTGLALGVAGLLLFSSIKLFAETRDVIVYFDDSLNGLSEGAPVKYRGVSIGTVKRVMVRYNQATNDYAMPVILELQRDLIRQRLGEPGEVFDEATLKARVKLGLRASLQTESLVTGVLYVDIRPNPDAPPPRFHQIEKVYPELPTERTQIQKLFNNLASLDAKALEQNLNGLILKLEATLDRVHVEDINRGVTNLLGSIDRLVSTPEITNSLVAARATLEQYRLLAERLDRRVDPLADRLTNSLVQADLALAQLRGAAENLRTLLAPDSAVRHDLDQALQQLASAAQSITALVDFLKRNPNAILVGRELFPKKP